MFFVACDEEEDKNNNSSNHPPETPILLSPADSSDGLSITSIELSWICSDPEEDILSFDLYLGLETDPPLFASDLEVESCQLTDLQYGKKYYWYVVAKDDFNNEVNSEIFCFKTLYDPNNQSPGLPANIFPENESIWIDNQELRLNWSCDDPDEDNLTYSIYFDSHTPPQQLIQNYSETYYQLDYSVEFDTEYFWQIIAYDDQGNNSISEMWSFRTKADPAEPSQLITAVTNFGVIGDPNGILSSMEFPAGSNCSYLWEGRTWVGAVRNGQRFVSHADYDHYEFNPSADSGPRPQKEWVILGNGGYEYSSSYDDLDFMVGHSSLGIQVNEQITAYHYEFGPAQVLFVQQEIVNVSDESLDSVFVAWIADFDMSLLDNTNPHMDDMCSFQEERKLAYMWDGDNPDEEGDDTGDNGISPAYAGIALIDSPAPLASFQWWNWEEDPEIDGEKYMYMIGTHPVSDGQPFRNDPENVFDYRVLLSTGPFYLEPGESVEVSMIYAIGYEMEGLNIAVDSFYEYYTPSH